MNATNANLTVIVITEDYCIFSSSRLDVHVDVLNAVSWRVVLDTRLRD